MKTQTLKFTTLLALLATTLLLANCKGEPSCPDAQVSTRYMSEEYKKILPYTGFDTLYFLSNTNDTIECIGQGRSTFFEPNSVREMNPDCNVYYTTNYEGYKDDYSKFEIIHSSSPIPPYDYWSSSFKINWETCKFNFYTFSVGKKTDNTNFYDSLVINKIWHYKVTEFKGFNNSDRLFINRSNGIIKLYNASTKNTLSLIKY